MGLLRGEVRLETYKKSFMLNFMIMARAGLVIITTTERVGSESELGELSLTPHRLLSPRITRRETLRHGVGVFYGALRSECRHVVCF